MKQLLEHAKLSIENDPEHHLQLPIRKKLWLAIGPVEEDADGHAIRSPAYKMRVKLALYTCRKVLPIWERHLPASDIAPKALKLAEAYLQGTVDYDTADKTASSLLSGLNNTQGLSDEQLNAVLVGWACVDALYISLIDNYCDDLEELDEELDTWDYSMYAAGAYAGGYPWQEEGPFKSDPEKLKEFWNWYLEEAAKLAE